MATNTYVALDKVTANGSVSSVTFTGISSAYTDLVIVFNGNSTTAGSSANSLRVSVNGDTASNYSYTYLAGAGTSAASGRATSQTYWDAIDIAQASSSGMANLYFMNYSNATTFKTMLSRSSVASVETLTAVNLWRSTSAITSITLNANRTITSGSTFSLYGIRAEGVSPAAKATGGAIYSDADYYYHVFGSTGTFTPSTSLTADVLVVAGGGGCGATYGSAGGAGGLLGFMSQSLSATGYAVQVGAGGAGQASSSGNGSTGSDSQFGALTLVKGGGYGAGGFGNHTGGSGGSGGGGNNGGVGGSPTSGQGFAGGTALSPGAACGGGAGGSPISDVIGGIGSSTYSSWGEATGVGELSNGVYYLAGGGGRVEGGIGGGGGANKGTGYPTGYVGRVNTGGGGGTPSDNIGYAGGSGVVIVRYLKV